MSKPQSVSFFPLLGFLMSIPVIGLAFINGSYGTTTTPEPTSTASPVSVEECIQSANTGSNMESVTSYCTDFEQFSEDILKSKGVEYPVVVSYDNGDSGYCIPTATACVYRGDNTIYINKSKFSSYDEVAEDNFFHLTRVLVHEHMHVLTSNYEHQVLEGELAEVFENEKGIEPQEIIADCGAPYFMENYVGAYIENSECEGKWEHYANKVRTDYYLLG